MKKLFFKTSYDADSQGLFGDFGGVYVPEMLMPALKKLVKAYEEIKSNPPF